MTPQPLIAIWKHHSGDLLGDAINFITHAGEGGAQHAGWLRSDGKTIHEAYLPQVRQRLITEAEKPLVRLFALEGLGLGYAEKFERYFDLAVDPKFAASYSITGLFGYLLNLPKNDQQRVFCSEYVMQGIRKIAPELLPLVRCENEQVSPRDLLVSPRLIELDWSEIQAQ